MKHLILILLFASSTTFAATEFVKFKTINQARSAGAIHALCFSRDVNPQLTFTFDQSFESFTGSSGTLVLVMPQQGVYVRDWTGPANTGLPSTWAISPQVGDMTITGRWSAPFNEQIIITIKDATNGKFPGNVSYTNFSTGVITSREVRCYLMTGNWKPTAI
jgi:hypothetical protein